MMLGAPLLLGGDGYQISRSVRLRSSASAYFSRTPGSAGTRTTWTWSGWVKRGAIANGRIISANTGNQSTYVGFVSDTIQITRVLFGSSTQFSVATAAVFRDPSAWYHIIVVMDTTNATSGSRVRLFVNNVQQTLSGTFPALNETPEIGSNITNYIGVQNSTNFGLTDYLDGYLTEVNFIDGQALTPAAFGETDAITGVWKPKKYAGTYGTNGFFLNFSDNSAATAAAIGKDYSGNGNNWTPNNISVTAGATYDSMLDVPTAWADGGNGRGNYAVMNPLVNAPVLSAGNLNVSGSDKDATGTIAFPSSGQWYFEMLCSANAPSTNNDGVGLTTGSVIYIYRSGGTKLTGGTSTAYGATYATGDTIGVAFDADAGTLTFYKNNTSQGTAFTGLSSATQFFPYVYSRATTSQPTLAVNFGQRPFAYTQPSGFKALNTQNLPEPTIKKGNQYFDATVWQGNSSTQNIVNSGAMQPDLVWVKDRSTVNIENHWLADSVRGATKHLSSNLTDAEYTFSTAITGFNSNGFAVGADGKVNRSADSYVGWQWKKGATPGFDIVTYTGTGVGRTIAHSLGVAPAMMIVKARSSAVNWRVFHQYWGGDRYLELNTTLASTNNGSVPWNSFVPTSSLFGVGTDSATNANGVTYVAYLFSEVAGFSKFGSYTGNGSTDGPFVYCGFRPRWVLVKVATEGTTPWTLIDTARSSYNATANNLFPNNSNAENTSQLLDILSNGFKARINDFTVNGSGQTYIFAAFAENPFKYSLAR